MEVTTEIFVKKATEKFNGKYDYSKTIYTGYYNEVVIICPLHGEFLQSPKNHMISTVGCRKCCENHGSTTEKFIAKAIAVHGDKYDYSKTVYIKSNQKVIITCRKHGDFQQIANSHLGKSGCKLCAEDRQRESLQLGTEEFIRRAIEKHGNRYDYSKVEYINKDHKVIIICRKHGEFLQRPHNHLKGSRCPKCVERKSPFKIKRPAPIKCNADDFIRKAKLIHGNKYDYSKTVYINSKTKLVVTCRKHGDFSPFPTNHLRGTDCPVCGHEKNHNALRIGTEEFIRRATEKHGDKYDYSKAEYHHKDHKVTIVCRKHGEFLQSPHNHVKGAGCAKCKESRGESRIRLYLEKTLIDFISQGILPGCKNKANLKFDFLIKIAGETRAIEFHGKQHYVPISFGGSVSPEDNFARTQKTDSIKMNWCTDQGILLLVIPYTDFDRIEEILDEFISQPYLLEPCRLAV